MVLPSEPWSDASLGKEDAAKLRRAIVEALLETRAAVANTQQACGSKQKQPAGQARWLNHFERLVEHVVALGLPDTQVFRPPRAPYQLVVVSGMILFPYHVGSVRIARPDNKWPKKMSQLVKELFTFARSTSWSQPALQLWDSEVEENLPSVLSALPEGTRLTLVPYTLNQAGLLQIWWGEARLLDDQGNLEWTNGPEELVITVIDDHQTGSPFLTAVTEITEDPITFDSGDLPEMPLSTRPDSARLSDDTPPSEPQPTEPKSQDDDQD